MKNLLYKEWKLALHPTSFIFLSFGILILIPNYPYYVAFLYMCMSVFFLFLSGRENKDVFFTVMLPIRKADVVKARCIMIAIIEAAQILISIPFAILSCIIYAGVGNQAGIEPNVAFYGLVFGMFALFNAIYITGFYKTAYKIGKPFLFAATGIVLYYVLAELLVWIPSPVSVYLDTNDPALMAAQLPVLVAGILVWAGAMVLTCRRAVQRFERVDV